MFVVGWTICMFNCLFLLVVAAGGQRFCHLVFQKQRENLLHQFLFPFNHQYYNLSSTDNLITHRNRNSLA